MARQKNEIMTRHESRQSLPTLLYFLFSSPHIYFNTIIAKRALAHLQAAQADLQTQACKRANFVNARIRTMDFKKGILHILTDNKTLFNLYGF